MESNYEKLIPCKRKKTAYRMSVTLRTESAILGSGCGGLGALEKHLPGIFVRHVEEPAQSLVLHRSNSHRLKARCWHGRIKQMSIT